MRLSGRLRRVAWRLGRKIYCAARGETANQMRLNGEMYAQRCVLGAQHSDERLTVFDVGANLGDWSQALLDQTPPESAGRLDLRLFEPSAESFERIKARFAGAAGTTCERIALSDQTGRARLMMASATGGTNTLEFDKTLERQAVGVAEIETATAAEYCSRNAIDHVHLLKCDTEGHDLKVVKGAASLLAEERIDVLQFEYNHRWIHARAFLKDVFDLVEDSPYIVAALRPARIDLLRSWHMELERFFEANYLLVHPRALAWFAAHDGSFDVSNTYA